MKRFILFYLSAIILSSCSLKKIAVQIPDPPEFSIPAGIKSMAILNRSINANFVDTKDVSLVPKFKSAKIRYDITASDSALLSAARTIFDSQRFDVVVPINRNISHEDRNLILEPLDSAYIHNICKDFNVDAVLVLEKFSQWISQRMQYGDISLNNVLIWRLYQPGLIPTSMLTNETLHWFYDLDIPYKRATKHIPHFKEMLVEGGIISGQNIARQIGCVWQNHIRYYYKTGKKDVDAAIPLIMSDKWEEASDIWHKFSSVSSPTLLSKIEFNLALASEMAGDINGAIDWANKSLQTRPFPNTKIYLKELNNRKTLLGKHPD